MIEVTGFPPTAPEHAIFNFRSIRQGDGRWLEVIHLVPHLFAPEDLFVDPHGNSPLERDYRPRGELAYTH